MEREMKSLFVLTAALFITFTVLAADEKYWGLPLSGTGHETNIVDRYGVPFLQDELPLKNGGSARVAIAGNVDRIFLLGMTDQISENERTGGSHRAPSELIRPAVPADAWKDPRDQSVRFWVGDWLGQMNLEYLNGIQEVYPLILGQSVWWGRFFYDYSEPFVTDTQLHTAFTTAIRLFPPTPTADGDYIAVIKPQAGDLRAITFVVSAAKKGTIGIRGITLETTDTLEIPGAIELSPGSLAPEFEKFANERTLRALGEDKGQTDRELQDLRLALYSTDESFKGPVTSPLPPGYSGPDVSFKGNLSAEVLAYAFYYNVQDIRNKIDAAGRYHTSTSGALSWGGYKGIGFFREGLGRYYDNAFSRDMGRSLQEITMLGYTNEARRCADWALQMADRWETDPRLKIDGLTVPPHWGQLVERPAPRSFENDGQGLMTLFIYKAWQWLPNRDEWLRAHWPDVKGLGDWILWQFEHPEISKATNGLLHTTGESAAQSGYSVYPDTICMDALRALAEMADSLSDTSSAAQWRSRANKMQEAIAENYIIHDPKYGRVWTLDYAGWPNKSTVLGPLIFLADYNGFSPRNETDDWRSVNKAAYRRLIDTYTPFGFYGQAMGYGQGFVTESALLLDRMRDATTMLDRTAKEIYDPRFNQYDHFIVPEGAQVSPSGQFWFRIGDLGNGVQEGEIVKTLRLVIGIDDTRPGRLQFYPRMPYGWRELAVSRYPVLFETAGSTQTAFLQYQLRRSGKEMELEISADQPIGPVAMRLGPFEKQPEVRDVQVNGRPPANGLIEHSGDSWWVRFTADVNIPR